MKEFAIISKKSIECLQDKYSGKKLFGNYLCIGICLNSCFLSIPYILDIYTKKHKVLWNINDINYISILFMILSQKSLDCAHGVNQKAEQKKKKRTRKDTENIEALGMTMEMTLSITNKLVENLFHENKYFFHMFSCV